MTSTEDATPEQGGDGAAEPTGPVDTASVGPGEPAAAEPGTDPEPAARTGMAAFAAAIARKKTAGQERSAHLDGSAKVGGATSNHKTSRTFRRKSG